MQKFYLTILLAFGSVLLTGCASDGLYGDNGYYSSGGGYNPPRYYPDEMTSGYNRNYHHRDRGYQSSQGNGHRNPPMNQSRGGFESSQRSERQVPQQPAPAARQQGYSSTSTSTSTSTNPEQDPYAPQQGNNGYSSSAG